MVLVQGQPGLYPKSIYCTGLPSLNQITAIFGSSVVPACKKTTPKLVVVAHTSHYSTLELEEGQPGLQI